MPRKSRIQISKTWIRHQFRHLAQYESMTSTVLGDTVRDGRAERQRALEPRAASLPPELQEFLADEAAELDIISCLADLLSVVALYQVVEINTGRMLAHEFWEGRSAKEPIPPMTARAAEDPARAEVLC